MLARLELTFFRMLPTPESHAKQTPDPTLQASDHRTPERCWESLGAQNWAL